MTGTEKGFRFDVAFSFAGPHRDKVRAIAEFVAAKLGREKVFFDEWYEHEILGDDMDVLLQRIYHEQSLMVVADLSDEYAERPWTKAEARAIRALRFDLDPARDETGRLRLLNARFGEGNVPGVFKTTAYLDGINKTAEQCAELILKRHALLTRRLAGEPAVAPAVPAPSTVVSPATPIYTLPTDRILFLHPATNDALYSRRERQLDWLDGCAKDARIRIVTVTGIGGLGKTSLVGHWIKVRRGWQHRAFCGVFFYSFYSDRAPEHFFAAFIDFASKSLGQNRSGKEVVLHHAAATLAQRWPFLIVLDGLEVLQEDSHCGWINQDELNEFVSRLGEKGSSLLLLTSRFLFPQVTRQFSGHARPLELEMLSPDEGADLLEKCGLPEDRETRMAFSAQFGGHPLALRLFAGASMAEPTTDPSVLSREVMRAEKSSTLPDPAEPEIADEERQRRRHRRQFQKLLEWLQAKLPPPKRRLLQLVALFREPVPTATLIALATGLDAMKADFFDCDPTRIRTLLDALVREHLLQREDVPGSDIARWAAHPIVREVFRETALVGDDTIAPQFAEIVAGKGEGSEPKSRAELQPIIEAIEVLLAGGDFGGADELFRRRLDNGSVFLNMPAPREGLLCARSFSQPAERRRALRKALGRQRLCFFLSEVALRSSFVGEMERVEQQYEEVCEIDYRAEDWNNLSIDLINLCDAQALLGHLEQAVGSASESLFYAGVKEIEPLSGPCHLNFIRPSSIPKHNADQEPNSFAFRAHVLSLAARLPAASRDFARADTRERKISFDNYVLPSLRGIQWTRHRHRLGDSDVAQQLTLANRALCETRGWNTDLARCDLLLGELDLKVGNFDAAARRIGEALRVFRKAHVGQDLPPALLAQARLRRSIEDCEEGLRLAARSGFALMQCDALNLRALLHREYGEADKAAEDARDALEIAERCGYYWGRHEALRQLRDAAKTIGHSADERHWDEAEQELSKRMQPLIKEALEIEHAHDREMAKLYGKKKKKSKK